VRAATTAVDRAHAQPDGTIRYENVFVWVAGVRPEAKERAMRVLFTTHPAAGHFHPQVPLAEALVAAGHEVAFACSPALST